MLVLLSIRIKLARAIKTAISVVVLEMNVEATSVSVSQDSMEQETRVC